MITFDLFYSVFVLGISSNVICSSQTIDVIGLFLPCHQGNIEVATGVVVWDNILKFGPHFIS
jgi:hypothetical protein